MEPENVTFEGGPWPIDVLWYPSSATPGKWIAKVVANSVDVMTGNPSQFQVEHEVCFDPEMLTPEARRSAVADIVREVLIDHFRHEIEECLRIDGHAVFSPHSTVDATEEVKP